MTTLSGGISMRTRTAVLLFGAAAATGAAAIGAASATLYGQLADEKHHQALMAMSRAFFAFPGYGEREAPAGAASQQPELVLVKGGAHT